MGIVMIADGILELFVNNEQYFTNYIDKVKDKDTQ